MKIRLLLGGFFALLLIACSEKKERYQNIDFKDVPSVNMETHRYEQALFSLDPQNFEQGLDAMAQEFRFFLGNNYQMPQEKLQLIEFLSSPIQQEAWSACQKKYADIGWLEHAVADGLQRFRYFYPETSNVVLYSYISGYNWEHPVHILKDTLVVGIDNYLGADFEVYKKLQIPQYVCIRMDSAYMVSEIFQELIISHFWGVDQPKTLIDHIISAGKTYYFLDILLPKTPDEYKIGYTAAQLQFCKNNEDLIWKFFVENNLLFTTDFTHVRSFILDAPFTNGFPSESPGRIGQWIGWEIVASYMNKNNDVTLQDLMLEKDYAKILQKSGYKPKR